MRSGAGWKMAFSAGQLVELFTIGIVAGVLGGLLGIGGGVVMIPAMALLLGDRFGVNSFHLYKLAAIATSVILSVPAAVQHDRAGNVVRSIIPRLIPLALAGAVAGVVAAAFLSGVHTRHLKQVFGVCLEMLVAFNVYQSRGAVPGEKWVARQCPTPWCRWRYGLVIGVPTGLIAGLLGIAGGVWAVPAQWLLFGIRLRHAIANSSTMIVPVAGIAAISQSIAVSRLGGLSVADGWWLTAFLAPGAAVGGWLGAALCSRLPTKWLRYGLYVVLAAAGVRLIFP
jgi:uncharacterized membrane protein YfcA